MSWLDNRMTIATRIVAVNTIRYNKDISLDPWSQGDVVTSSLPFR